MSPIRIGIIGLSATNSWAVEAHLPYLQISTKYQITGVCNSSLQSSLASIKAHNLSFATTNPYGSVADLVANPDIDLIVCAVRVDRHYKCLKPALEAGKDCFVEWPLASNLEQATELLRLAEAKGVKTMVGLQGQVGPVVQRVKELIESQSIGRVLSSSVNLSTGMATHITFESMEYLNDDCVSYVLGELQTVSATLSTQQKDVTVKAKDGNAAGIITRTTADHISMSGLFASGAQSFATVLGRGAVEGEPPPVWRIEGEKGVLDIRGERTMAISMSEKVKIRLHDDISGGVTDVEFTEDRPGHSGNVGRLYEAFADGWHYPDWEWAVKRHAWVEALYESEKLGRRVSYSTDS